MWRGHSGLHLTGFGTRLYLATRCAGAAPGLYLAWLAGHSRLHLSRFGPRLYRRLGLAGQRGLYRVNLLLRRQFLDLRLLLRAQLHGGFARQGHPGNSALHRLGRQGRGLGNLGRQRRHIFRGRDDVGSPQVRLGLLDVGQSLSRRQTLALHQGRRSDLSDPGLLVSTFWGGLILRILVMLVELLMIVLLITVWLMLVTREM